VCAHGEFSRSMAKLGGGLLATDFSAQMLERARGHEGRIEYQLADAADQTALLELGEPDSFDGVVCNMAIMRKDGGLIVGSPGYSVFMSCIRSCRG
jgi:2-polyprenyl-3-methyl-5-hydroxy-6-metoxy-1,4-benzoquinol methylase